jgi:hypothetical protein
MPARVAVKASERKGLSLLLLITRRVKTLSPMGPFLRSLNHPELGIGSCARRTGNTVEIEYFDSPIADRSCVTVPFGQVRRVSWRPKHESIFSTRRWSRGELVGSYSTSKSDVSFACKQGGCSSRRVAGIYPLAEASADPCDYLASRTTETPFFHGRRTRLLANLVRQRAACGGMTALILVAHLVGTASS